MLKKIGYFVVLVAPLAVTAILYAQTPQVYSGNSGVLVTTSPAICVNYGGKVSYLCRNRTSSVSSVWCWHFTGSATPAATPAPGSGVELFEVPAGATFRDTAYPEQNRDPLLQGVACAQPTATSTASTIDGVWR